MNDFFRLPIDNAVAHLQLNRPERMNTMAPAFFPALRDAVQALHDEAKARVLVIRSTGKQFSAGMALDTFAQDGLTLSTATARERLNFQDSLRKLTACINVLDTVRLTVICAIQGGCIGGALGLAAACGKPNRPVSLSRPRPSGRDVINLKFTLQCPVNSRSIHGHFTEPLPQQHHQHKSDCLRQRCGG